MSVILPVDLHAGKFFWNSSLVVFWLFKRVFLQLYSYCYYRHKVLYNYLLNLLFIFFFTSLLIIQGTLRDLSKGGRSLSMDHMEPVCTIFLSFEYVFFSFNVKENLCLACQSSLFNFLILKLLRPPFVLHLTSNKSSFKQTMKKKRKERN